MVALQYIIVDASGLRTASIPYTEIERDLQANLDSGGAGVSPE